nr:immunoglobulin light chain junction region [Macaca mulatta]
CQQHNTYPSTF